MKKLLLLLIPSLLFAANEPINTNSVDGKVRQTASGTGSSSKPFDFSDVNVLGIAGGGGGGVVSISASSPIIVTPNPILTTGTVSLNSTSKTQWDTAYSERKQWDGGATSLVPATGRTSLGLGSAALADAAAFEPQLSFDRSIVQTLEGGVVRLVGDITAPGNSRYYGTDAGGIKGWFALPEGGGTGTPGGSSTQVQFNDAGTFGGISTLTWNGIAVSAQTGTKWFFLDSTDITKRVVLDLSNIATANTRVLTLPDADSTTVQSSAAVSNQFLTGISSLGVISRARPTVTNLSNLSATSRLVGSGPAGSGVVEIGLGTGLTMTAGTPPTLNASASGGTPGGSNTQLQFNNSGVFGGVGTATYVGGELLFNSATAVFTDGSDPTKRFKFSTSNIPTSTTANVLIPNSVNPVVVAADAGATNNFLTGITALGIITKAQPAFSNLSGSIAATQNNLPVGATVYVDAVNGSPGGTRARFDKPFLTISQAIAAASAGDIIYVGPGVYTENAGIKLPNDVSLYGAGATITTVNSSLSSATKAVVNLGNNSIMSDISINATGASGVAVGALTGDSDFSNATISSCVLTGVSDGIKFTRAAGASSLTISYTTVATNAAAIAMNVGTPAITLYSVDLISDGLSANSSYGILSAAGTTRVFNSTTETGDAGASGDNIGVKVTGGTVEIHNLLMRTDGTGLNKYDLSQTGGTLSVENVTKATGVAPVTTGTITQLSRYALRDNNLSDIIDDAAARANLGLSIGTDVQGWDEQLESVAALNYTGNTGKIVAVNATEDDFELITPPTGGTGSAPVIQTVGNVGTATIAAGTQVVMLTTTLTSPLVLTLPAASGYAASPAIVIQDPKNVSSGANSVSVARSGSDTINTGTSNVVVIGSPETGGMVTLITDGVSAWSTMTKGGAMRVSGNIDGISASGSGKILKSNGTKFVGSVETYAAPGTSGNVMTSDGTNWTSAVPAGGATAPLNLTISDAATSTIVEPLFIGHNTSASPLAGFGSRLVFRAEDASTGAIPDAISGKIEASWTTATHGSNVSDMVFSAVSGGASGSYTNPMTLKGSGTLNVSGTGGGFTIGGTAPSGKFLHSIAGLRYDESNYTLPTTIGTTGKMLQSNGVNAVFSANTWPTSSTGAGKIIRDNGANFVESTATFPDVSGTSGNVLTSDGTNWNSTAPAISATSTTTFTNKRITPRVSTSTTGNTAPTPNADTDDQYVATGMTVNMVFGAPTGTPTDGQKLIIRIKDSGSVRTLGWNAAYRIIGVILPTTTVASKTIYVGCIWNAADSVWDVVAVSSQV